MLIGLVVGALTFAALFYYRRYGCMLWRSDALYVGVCFAAILLAVAWAASGVDLLLAISMAMLGAALASYVLQALGRC